MCNPSFYSPACLVRRTGTAVGHSPRIRATDTFFRMRVTICDPDIYPQYIRRVETKTCLDVFSDGLVTSLSLPSLPPSVLFGHVLGKPRRLGERSP